MARSWSQGVYVPTNPGKYKGAKNPTYRSSWEKRFMVFCDLNENILEWASESHRIPYVNPITGVKTNYVPDFLIVYKDKYNQIKTEMIEIKPQSQIPGHAKSNYDKAMAIINESKWKSAKTFCDQLNIGFRIITENQIFEGKK